MKIKRKYLFSSYVVFFLLFFSIGESAKDNKFDRNSLNETSTLPSLIYVIHAAIEIGSDSEFNASNGVSSGSGSKLDPFIIDGLNITVDTGHGLYVHNTTAYFVIRNCWINTGGIWSYPDKSGIHLQNTSQGTAIIENNYCTESYYGISFTSSNNNLCASSFI